MLFLRRYSFVAAIPVGPESRSRWSTRSEPRANDWTVGGHLMRPPRSRNVADRRATAAHVPAVLRGSRLPCPLLWIPADLDVRPSPYHASGGRRQAPAN